MYRLDHTVAHLLLADYVASYRDSERFMAYCRECRNYGRYWSCPPFDFDPDEQLRRYAHAWIIGTRIEPDDSPCGPCASNEERIERCRRIIASVRATLDARLLALEDTYPGSRAFLAGSCFECPEGQCARACGQPCIRSRGPRHSLESFGFDIGLTASKLLGIELQWSYDERMPEYLTLVSGLLTPTAEGPGRFPAESPTDRADTL